MGKIKITPYKLTHPQKLALTKFLHGELSVRNVATTLGLTTQSVYTMCAAIFKHSVGTGRIDVEALLKDY